MTLDSFAETAKIFSVDEISRVIKSVIDDSSLLKDVRVRGEITNFYHQRNSGHMYFDIKSRKSKLKCVSFRGMNQGFKFMPKNGMNVVVRGYVTTYGARSEYQIMVKDIRHDGAGDLHEEFERLKLKLMGEGLFEDVHKKAIPVFPKKIGIATGAASAALHDILKIIKRRYPCVELIVVPTIVQGAYAEDSIISSLQMLDQIEDLDVIILGRGGGSLEDLWAFNLETVVRAVFRSDTPVITGIGHQTDFTLCDFVADFRAPTPSAAAEKAVPDSRQLTRRIEELKRTAAMIMTRAQEKRRFQLDTYADNIIMKEPERVIYPLIQHRDDIHTRLERTMDGILKANRNRLRVHDQSSVFLRPHDNVNRLSTRFHQQFDKFNIFSNIRFRALREQVDVFSGVVLRNAPRSDVKRLEETRGKYSKQLRRSILNSMKFRKKSMEKFSVLLGSLSPYNVLERGYAVVMSTDKKVINDAGGTRLGDTIEVRFRSSGLKAEVKEKEEDADERKLSGG